MSQQIESVVSLPVDRIVESPTNPRKVFAGMEELTASVAAKGIISPVVVRPLIGGADSPEVFFELCFGHRRMRAAKAAGLEVVPAIVRPMDDAELVEAQLVENIQRADITELEEADAFAALIAQGYTGPRIVAATGKTRAYVYARLKLAELGQAGRQAIQEGKLAASSALLVARVPSKLQELAVEKLLQEAEYFDDGQLTVREVREVLDTHVFRRLNRAQWSLDDAELLPSAGACSSCPKSSLGDPDLAAQGSADVCTDPACWDAKVAALYQLRVRKAEARGGRARTDEDMVDGFDVLSWKSSTGESFEELAEKLGVQYAPFVEEANGRIYEIVDRVVYDKVTKSTDDYQAQEKAREKARATSQKRMEAEDKKREEQTAKLRQIWDAVLEHGQIPAWALTEYCEQWRHLLPYDRQDAKLESYGALAAAFTTMHLSRTLSSNRSGLMSLDEALFALGVDVEKTPPVEKSSPVEKVKRSLALPPNSPATKAKPATKGKPAVKAKPVTKAKSAAKAKPATKAKPVTKAKPATKTKPAMKTKGATKTKAAKR